MTTPADRIKVGGPPIDVVGEVNLVEIAIMGTCVDENRAAETGMATENMTADRRTAALSRTGVFVFKAIWLSLIVATPHLWFSSVALFVEGYTPLIRGRSERDTPG